MEFNCSVRGIVGILCMMIFFRMEAADSLRMERDDGQNFIIHQVEKGETMYSLSRRYHVGIDLMARQNGIVNNQLALGQMLRIPVNLTISGSTPTREISHTVMTGETLYSLSRKYNVTIGEIMKWNSLESNVISIGQVVVIRPPAGMESPKPIETPPVKTNPVESPAEEVPVTDKAIEESGPEPANDEFTTYYVQSGDLLESIAQKFNVRPDSIVIWNQLSNAYLAIGQKLLIKGTIDPLTKTQPSDVKPTPYGTIRKSTDQSGFVKVFEEGIAGKIDSSVETDKYLALHRTLKIGTLIEVRNLMNNQKVFVRVVGKLPETGLNENVLVRLTPVCFERLGVIDPKTRVEVSYYEE